MTYLFHISSQKPLTRYRVVVISIGKPLFRFSFDFVEMGDCLLQAVDAELLTPPIGGDISITPSDGEQPGNLLECAASDATAEPILEL